MLYLVLYNIPPYQSGGQIFTDKTKAIEYAMPQAQDMISDIELEPGGFIKLYDLSGIITDAPHRIDSDNHAEVVHQIEQLNSHLVDSGGGCFKFSVYDDLIQLTKGEEYRVLDNIELMDRVEEFEATHKELIDDISHALDWLC